MSGTKAGGMKAAATNKAKYGDGFYARIGAKGGRNGHTGGFAANPELAKLAGAKGGRKSRRYKMQRDSEGNAIKKNGEKANYHGPTKQKKAPKIKSILAWIFGRK